MDTTRGGPSAQLLPLRTIVAHSFATHGIVVCDASNGRPALVRAFRGAYGIVNYTEKQCSKALTRMLSVVRGIVRPENTKKAFVAKAVGADTFASRYRSQW